MKRIIFILLLCASSIWTLPKGSRIIGGEEAFAGEFPYASAIYKTTPDPRCFCTGSLLNPQWVITAGQCVDGAISFTILLGTHKLSGDNSTAERLATDTYALHPDYNPNTLENDIGLIKFRAPVTYTTSYIRNLDVPYADMGDTSRGDAFGWGQTSDDDPEIADTLHKVTLAAISDAKCRLVYGNQLGPNVKCLQGNYNEGTCFGDGGSPITQYISRGYIIVIAIASFFSSNGCERLDPSGYTSVSLQCNDWINTAMNSYFFEFITILYVIYM